MTIERLKNPSAGELDALTDLWEASVRATHDFLAPEDIAFSGKWSGRKRSGV